ncbi:MAG: membrane integrity-associated transporter subunit PqiC [Halioglobus sp.]|nr:membrane integrity-associated transporter subunit PqiC [Halioglobus sp.]
MTSTLKQISASLCLLLCLMSCASSPPSNFYRLTPAVDHAPGGPTPSLGIGPVDIPEFLNRNALVYTRGGNQLQLAESERWAEPLDDGITRVLGLNLSALLQTETLRFFPWDLRQAPDYGVRINILDLDARDGQAILVADWLLYRPGNGATIASGISQFSTALPAGELQAAQLPAAYSALLFELSQTIAAAIKVEMQNPP